MKKFKESWEIQHNWQLLFPALGLIGLLYSCFKLAGLFPFSENINFLLLYISILFVILLKIILWLFKKLETRWIVTYRWEIIRIFIVFAITGSSSLLIGRPIIKYIGITKENLNPLLYWLLFIIIGLIFYQILLVTYGWLFGQFKFFWEFEKKMLRRFGLKRFLD
ncbi:DUF6787 family protein [Bizionia myxarmorum]|uniref:DUF6787 domain-containing protein n=1 Tax=Bizionia myxarmorum TaxID=291186 RepID=A0A5D0R6K9_9FLAO|nr:DUF6787 family protein [Bizionia myxarmorum]TYB76204.1 hypothetical protein ES674_11460 [Bizionia myxarmorum]